jgi:hypothetical protein
MKVRLYNIAYYAAITFAVSTVIFAIGVVTVYFWAARCGSLCLPGFSN